MASVSKMFQSPDELVEFTKATFLVIKITNILLIITSSSSSHHHLHHPRYLHWCYDCHLRGHNFWAINWISLSIPRTLPCPFSGTTAAMFHLRVWPFMQAASRSHTVPQPCRVCQFAVSSCERLVSYAKRLTFVADRCKAWSLHPLYPRQQIKRASTCQY